MSGIIITGGTKGIGRSLVHKFASEGFDIATCSRSESDLNQLKDELRQLAPKVKVHIKSCDVSVKSEIQSFGKFAVENLGTPDALINSAGIFLPGSLSEEKDGIFEYQINVNLASAYHLTRMVLPSMIEAKKGYIFNFCSSASITAYTNGGSYCISKFGMLGFSKVLREEMKNHNIRVSSVLPGATNTASWEGSGLPEERFMNPDDVAALIYYFYRTPPTMNIEEILLRPFLGDIV